MHDLRSDTPPLPVLELAPVLLESNDPAEPFLLGAGPSARNGRCCFELIGLRRTGRDFVAADRVASRAVITPLGVVRTSCMDDVLVTERVALLNESGASVVQWTVDRDAELMLDRDRGCHLDAGRTLTAFWRGTGVADIGRSFRQLAGGVTRAVTGGVGIETQDRAGTALAWAKSRLWLHDRAGSASSLAALAAPVIGRPDQLRSQLDQGPVEVLPLLAARFAAWTGRLEDVRTALTRATPAIGVTGIDAGVGDASRVLRLAGMAELERTAADLGLARLATELRALARRYRTQLSQHTLDPPAAAMLAALTAPADAERSRGLAWWTETDDVAHHAWRTWAALAWGLACGIRAWQRLLGVADSPVRGAWSAHFGAPGDDPAATALFVLTLTHGVLGLEPDAARHRIRIAPRLTALNDFTATGIPCGDAHVSLRVRHEDRQSTIRIMQETGAIPLTAVLEPWLGGPIAKTWVDGRSAQLDPRPCGDGMVVSVQLVLDEERALTVERPSL